MQYRIIIAGSRSFTDYNLLELTLDNFIKANNIIDAVIVSGHCKHGADAHGEEYYRRRKDECNLSIEIFPANWDMYGKPAGHIRNKEMAIFASGVNDDVDCKGVLFAFWDKESPGTLNMIENAKRCGLEIKIVIYEKPTLPELVVPSIIPSSRKQSFHKKNIFIGYKK